MTKPLEWFPKRFAPGDMDASGGDRLLGKTELSRLAVLIRESAQNSWDARRDGTRPLYGINLRRTDFRLREDLATLLSEGRLDELERLKRRTNFRILEVYDRGTEGLDGPFDLSPAGKGRSARFQDLILKFGVSHNNGSTGGTYGFGKTAAFAYSGIGTVIYWTRCRNPEGVLEDRFIASAFGDSYLDGGHQYTGRHWWGIRSEDDESILPVIGSAAAELGAQFFRRGFAQGETGTSILILDPLVADAEDAEDSSPAQLHRFSTAVEEMEDDFAQRARRAIRENLWPKLIAPPGLAEGPMEVELRVNDELLDLGDARTGALALWGAGLNAIRAERAGQDRGDAPRGAAVQVHEVTRYGKTIGHLALVLRSPGAEQYLQHDDLDPAREDESRLLRIALMRGQAELVVTTVDWVQREAPAGMDWLAVYKSADDFDEHYAEAEPPAHDNWVTDGSSSESSKIVRHTKSRVKNTILNKIYPQLEVEAPEVTGAMPSTGALSKRLGAILPVAQPKADAGGGAGGRAGRRRAETGTRWSVDAEPPRLVSTHSDGRQLQEVRFTVHGQDAVGRVKLSVSMLGDEGLHEAIDPELLNIQWGYGAPREGIDTASVRAGDAAAVRFIGPARRALRVELSAGGVDGRS